MTNWTRIVAETQIKISQEDLNLKDAPTSVQGGQVEAILMTVYMIAGIVAVIIIVLGGIRYVSSNGDPSSIKAAKDTVLYAVVGLVAVLMASAITDFVIKNVAK